MIQSVRKIYNLYLSSDKNLTTSIRNIFGIVPGKLHLYRQALRHRSLFPEINENNERLELLGDAVFSAVIADFFYRRYPMKDEGFLTEMKARIISRKQLNKLAKKLGISEIIEANNQTIHSREHSLAGNAFEALIGAIYLDKGFEKTKDIILQRIIHTHLDIESIREEEINFKSKLIEWSQKENITVAFKTIREESRSNRKYYFSGVWFDDEMVAEGEGYNKKTADQMAARIAMEKKGISKDE